MKYALVFPGQGAQQIGMGKELYDNFAEAKNVFDAANEILGYDLKKLVFGGPDEELKQTIHTQPAVFTASAACLEALKSLYPGIVSAASMTAGHSLGEYTALYAAGVFDLKEGLSLVKQRAQFIQEGSQKNKGTMAAIMGLDGAKLAELCSQITKSKGIVEPVNFNAPGQVVVSGTVDGVGELVNLAKTNGALKAVPLAVSGPFHSSLLREAAQKMGEALKNAALNDAKVPVVANYDAEVTTSAGEIKAKLAKQIDHPVYWEKSVGVMLASGIDTFIEIGPGKVVSGMIKRINKQAKTFNVEDRASLEKTLTELRNAGA